MSAGFQANMSRLRLSKPHNSFHPSSVRVEPIAIVCSGYFGCIATLILFSTTRVQAEGCTFGPETIVHSSGISLLLHSMHAFISVMPYFPVEFTEFVITGFDIGGGDLNFPLSKAKISFGDFVRSVNLSRLHFDCGLSRLRVYFSKNLASIKLESGKLFARLIEEFGFALHQASQAGQSCAEACGTAGYDPPHMIVIVGTTGPVSFGAYGDEGVVRIIARAARICMDYRKLSEIAIRNRCHQMRVHEEEIPKTDFKTRYGHFEFTVMPFGLTKAPTVFIELMRGARVAFEDEFRATKEIEVSCEAQQGQSGVKRKLFESFRNKMGNEPILALPEGSNNFVVMREARVMMRDVRTLIIKEEHATKYSVRPGAEIGEGKMIGLEMKQETTKVVVIKERLKEAKDCVVRFGKNGELAPRLIETFFVEESVRIMDHETTWPIVVRHESEKMAWPIMCPPLLSSLSENVPVLCKDVSLWSQVGPLGIISLRLIIISPFAKSTVISISSDSSDESVGPQVLQVILFGTIPTSIPVIPVVHDEVPIAPADLIVASKVGAVFVISPTGVLDLVDYSSSSNYDPSKDSLPIAPELPLVSPFLCFDDSEADSESEPAEQRPERHESLTPSFDFPLAPIVAPLGIRRRPAFFVRPGKAIPFGRPYRTHPNGPYFTPDPSSSSSSLDSSTYISLGSSSDSSSVHSPGQSHQDHRLELHHLDWLIPLLGLHDVVRILCVRGLHYSSFIRSAPLSTLYPPTTSNSSLNSSSERSLDSSSPSVRLSRKRCKSPTTLVQSSTLISRSIARALADLPPHKRFRDLGIIEGVGAHTENGIDLGVEVATSDIREDEKEFEAKAGAGGTMEIIVDPLATGCISKPTEGDAPDLEGTLYDISVYIYEVPLDRITEFETAQRPLEAERLGRQSSSSHGTFLEVALGSTMTNTRSEMTPVAIEEMINRRVTEALETHEANKNIGLGNGNNEGGNGHGNGNGNGRGKGNRNHNENDRDARPVSRECTYQDFMKCQPLSFKGTEGVVRLMRWFEKMEIVFHISNSSKKYQAKYATCTQLNNALTWWNSHKRTIGADAAFFMSWRELIKLIVKAYCPRTEIQKMESEL
uniref:Reverse transcriptase domain-containing protein n=1 Tax=Tanacetum cinerariifolium TaxID=118510 RepID=A0A6L2JUJ6_TANCI|nr:hypothetical protein [Tanacetum cinerariifolium]